MAKLLEEVLVGAKNLQIFDIKKITLPLPILLANALLILIDKICSIDYHDRVLLELYKLLITLMIVLLLGI